MSEVCPWNPLEDYPGSWQSGCANESYLEGNGGPKYHGYKFCPYCGKPLESED